MPFLQVCLSSLNYYRALVLPSVFGGNYALDEYENLEQHGLYEITSKDTAILQVS